MYVFSTAYIDLFSKFLLCFFFNVFRMHKKDYTIDFLWKTICSLKTNRDNAAALEKSLMLCASKKGNTWAKIFLESLTEEPRIVE